jgi:hypothetical protein
VTLYMSRGVRLTLFGTDPLPLALLVGVPDSAGVVGSSVIVAGTSTRGLEFA